MDWRSIFRGRRSIQLAGIIYFLEFGTILEVKEDYKKCKCISWAHSPVNFCCYEYESLSFNFALYIYKTNAMNEFFNL